MQLKPIKVSELNKFIKKFLSTNPLLNNLFVEGEVSNLRVSKNDITYFTLCDINSCINCICFFNANNIKNGDRVLVKGNINLYEPQGTYQINVSKVEVTGIGKILEDLEKLKSKLKSKGMFSKNKEIPLYPKKIGIITSKNGAAVKDILKTFDEISVNIDIYIFNSSVQGKKAIDTIINGIDYLNNIKCDIIMVCRGGGSFEDLNVFNSIDIAEKIYNSKVPIVTGIGHETDKTLTDFVADVCCHTPTAAALYVINGYKNVFEQLQNYLFSLKKNAEIAIEKIKKDIEGKKYILTTIAPLSKIESLKNIIYTNYSILKNNCNIELSQYKYSLDLSYEKLENNSYKKQLKKGFALVFDSEGNIVKNSNNVDESKTIRILFDKFEIIAKTIKIEERLDN